MDESLVLQVIERARSAAAKDGLKVCISVVDASGLMSGFLRMDDALPGSIDVSMKKARTAALFLTLGSSLHNYCIIRESTNFSGYSYGS